MTKKEYLDALRDALSGLDIDEVEEIIEDYENHFQAGIEDGKSEELLVEEFGSIDSLVAELKEMIPEAKKEYGNNDTEERQDEVQREGGCRNLDIDLICANVVLRMSDDNRMNMKYDNRGTFLSRARMRFSGYQEGDTFYAKETTGGFGGVSFNGESELIVDVPRNCVSVYIQSKSGDMEIRNIVGLDELRIKSKSGDIEVVGGTVKNAVLETISGDVEVRNHESVNLKAKTISGDVKVEGVTYKEGIIETISGDARVDELPKSSYSDISSVSGDVSVVCRDRAEGEAKTTSGDVKIVFDKECTGFELQKGGRGRNLFGDVRLRSSETVEVVNGAYCYGDRSCKIAASTVSGDISVVQYS